MTGMANRRRPCFKEWCIRNTYACRGLRLFSIRGNQQREPTRGGVMRNIYGVFGYSVCGLFAAFFLMNAPAWAAVPLQEIAWTRVTTGIGGQEGKAATTDANGNIYVIGDFNATSPSNPAVDFSNAGDTFDASSRSGAFLMRINADGSYAWTRAFGTGGTISANDVATDTAGNVYVTGAFSGTVNFSVNGTDSLTASGGGAFLTRFNGSGAYLGTTSVGGRAMSIAIDQSNNIYVAKATSYSSGTAVPISLAKYNTSGALVTTLALNGYANYGHDGLRVDGNDGMLAVDGAGNIYVTGVFSGTVLFGGTDSHTSIALSPFLTRINANLSYGWTWTPGYTSNNIPCVSGQGIYRGSCEPWGHQSIAVDRAGHVYFAGWFNDILDLGDGNIHVATRNTTQYWDASCACFTYYITNPFDDVFIAQFDAADGSYAGWSQIIDDSYSTDPSTPSTQDVHSVQVDGEGNVYVSGLQEWKSVLVARINVDHSVTILNNPYRLSSRDDVPPYTNSEDPTSVLGPDSALYVTGAYIRTVDFGDNDVLTSTAVYSSTLVWNGWEYSHYYYYPNLYLSRYAALGVVAPTANAGADQTHDGGATVTLNATGSGPMVGYEWTQSGGPTVTLSSAHSPTPTFSAPRVAGNTDLSFDLKVRNNDGLWSTGTDGVMVTVTPNLHPPVAVADAYTVDKTMSLAVSGNVLANDTDADGDVLTVASNTNPAHGTLSIAANGAFTYTTSSTDTGTSDSFTYGVIDGSGGVPVTATVSITIIQPSAGVDLFMTRISSGSTSSKPGVAISVSTTVRNGGATKSGAFAIGIYLSTDATITTADTLIATHAVSSLAGLTNIANTFNATIPSTMPAGAYYLGAIADYANAVVEDDDANNGLAGTALVVIRPDLVVTSLVAPATAPSGSAISTTTTEKNQGAVASTSNYVKLYLSTDATITAADTYLGQYSQAALAVGAGADKTLSVTIPAATAAGSYHLGAIADANNSNAESDESNNTFSIPIDITTPTPDLTVTAVKVSPTTAAQGATLTLTGTVKNIGTAKTGTASYAGFYLSNGVTDTFLKQINVSALLAAGASVNLSTTYKLPSGFAAGTYTIKLIADHTGAVSEIDETNNSLTGNTATVLP